MKLTKKLHSIKQIKLSFLLTLFAILAVFFMSSATWATTYHVDATNGDDSNPGTSEATAWKTISKVNSSSFNPGDSILFKRDEVWREQLIVPSSATSGQPITFGAYGTGDNPVISAADLVTNWTQHSGDIYKASLSTECHRVFYGATELMENDGNYASLGNNEWDWDRDYLYINIGQNPTGETIEATQRDYCLGTSSAKDYITIQNLYLKYNNDNAKGVIHSHWGSDYWSIDNCILEYGYGYGFRTIGGDGITFTNNIVRYNKLDGVEARSHDKSGGNYNYNTVYENGGGGGFVVTIQNATFSHNTIYNGIGHGFYVYNDFNGGNGCTFEYNEVYDMSSSGIRLSADNCIVRYNYFHDNPYGIYLIDSESSCDGNKIYYNIFEDINDIAYGVEAEGATNCKIYNNTFDGAGFVFVAGVHGNCSGNKVKNNIVYGGTDATLMLVNTSQSIGFESDYNCFYPTDASRFYWLGIGNNYNFADWKTASSQDAHSIHADPEFVSNTPSVIKDFKLKSASPCVNAGIDVGLTSDILGTHVPHRLAPDLGVLEHATTLDPPKNLRLLQNGEI
jgi:parallel beta-helix repeat protein